MRVWRSDNRAEEGIRGQNVNKGAQVLETINKKRKKEKHVCHRR